MPGVSGLKYVVLNQKASMLITLRSQAKTLKLPKYFTGKQCKHGHVAERYTDSGGCTVCVNGAAKPRTPSTLAAEQLALRRLREDRLSAQRAEHVAEAERKELARQAREQRRAIPLLATVKVLAFPEDVATLRSTALALVQMQYSLLTEYDLAYPSGGGVGLYRLRVPIEYANMLRDVAAALHSARTRDAAALEAVRVKQQEEVDRLNNEALPDWVLKP